ncbi:MAG TPA: glycoside hydrolase family 2 TIM barrel-domain containing protein [Candidatus Dormibacteraeota bacterium]|nr:glycoside hydrolase family 2 TIM barrel-domain containing protein [Candidatus Dormibacteraeota bacterium]
MKKRFGHQVALATLAVLDLTLLAGCQSQARIGLPTTLELRSVRGGDVAYQAGQPVPSFTYQSSRLRFDLDGSWNLEPANFAPAAAFVAPPGRRDSLTAQANGRQDPGYDTTEWRQIDIPGALNPPPGPQSGGAWLRRQFDLASEWSGMSVTLKFGAVNYIADIWLNGTYLGFHEGGSTPFAFDVTDRVLPGQRNLVLVRVDNPPWGSRNDIVPWGLADWWNYGGITQPVWLEAHPSLYVVRADVTPHLDSADISVVLGNQSSTPIDASLAISILPAGVTPSNLTDPDPKSQLPADAVPVVSDTVDAGRLDAGEVTRNETTYTFESPDLWTPQRPALYLLHITVTGAGTTVDDYWDTFGFRTISVDTSGPRLLLNGEPAYFTGAALHDERTFNPAGDQPAGGPWRDAVDVMHSLDNARAVNLTLIRADHHPPNPWLPLLADRLGFALWEEIPLYHYTPETFDIALRRGIAQQMLAEMVLRDMNRPSVLFHGFANESTGQSGRVQAMQQLHDLDRRLDGTRLTGQAAYGFDLSDRSSDPLDVAGFTFYYGVFYGGSDVAGGTRQALASLHATYPTKPIVVLEFGRWADTRTGDRLQRTVFEETQGALDGVRDTNTAGYLGFELWWSLEDYWTTRPGIEVERFGLFRPDGTRRPVADAVAASFVSGAGQGDRAKIRSGGVGRSLHLHPRSDLFTGYLLFAVLSTFALLGGILTTLWVFSRPRPAS